MKKPKAYLNILKLRVNMKLKRNAVRNYPVAAFIEPTLYCNLRCPACPTGLRLGLRPTAAIDEELFKTAIDEIGDYLFQLNMYNWGEPLLHKRTPEMIRYAKDKDIRIILSTNLSIPLSDEYIERLVNSGLDRMLVSLDGVTQETYSKYRRSGDINLVRENVRRIGEAKKRLGLETPTLVWQFLVFRHNEHEIEIARSIYKSWGLDEFTAFGAEMPMEPHDEGFEPSTIPMYNIYHPDHVLQKTGLQQMTSERSCSWLYGVLVLNPNGKVSPCCAVPSEQFDFATYTKTDKFFDVWNSEQFLRARRLFAPQAKKGPTKVRTFTREQQQAISKRIDGMSVRAITGLNQEKLICHKCPIPYLQNYTDPLIDEAIIRVRDGFHSEKGIRKRAGYLIRYLLTGTPVLYHVSRARAKFLSPRGPY